MTAAKDNTPDGTVVRTDQVISDYETISLASDVTINSILPGGRTLLADGIAPLAVGQQVCHFGVVTGESRHHRAGQQRLVHHGERRGQPEG